MTMTRKLLALLLLVHTATYAETMADQDFDGVPDSTDECPNTPFLNQVNAKGCTTTILRLPEETESESLTLALGHGFSINADLPGRERQNTSKIQLSYYYNDWSYSIRTGYYTHNEDSGILDTSIKIKKRIRLSDDLKLGLGAGVKLPTYDFAGNNTDFTLYSSLSYYPTSSLSVFTGFSHTFVYDDQIITPLQDTNSFYVGLGYFFQNDLYANISYAQTDSKFTDESAAQSIGTTLYYKINKKWFATVSYSHQLDDTLRNALNLKIGYKIW